MNIYEDLPYARYSSIFCDLFLILFISTWVLDLVLQSFYGPEFSMVQSYILIVFFLEKEMAAHFTILAWRVLWTEEPDGLLSMGLHRVGHDWSGLACMHALEKEMATHSSILAWRIPGTEEPGGLLSLGSHRVGHGWSTLAAVAAINTHCFRFKKYSDVLQLPSDLTSSSLTVRIFTFSPKT